MPTIDEYLAHVTPSQKAEFERIRKIIHEVVPEVEETISYGIPVFNYQKKYLIYVAAFKNHMSMYPASDSMVEALGEKVGKLRTSKGTLQFTEKNPLPESVIKDIILFRLNDITSG